MGVCHYVRYITERELFKVLRETDVLKVHADGI